VFTKQLVQFKEDVVSSDNELLSLHTFTFCEELVYIVLIRQYPFFANVAKDVCIKVNQFGSCIVFESWKGVTVT